MTLPVKNIQGEILRKISKSLELIRKALSHNLHVLGTSENTMNNLVTCFSEFGCMIY